MIFPVACLLVRRLLGCLMVLARGEVPGDAGLLMLRHQNAVLRRQISRVRYQLGGRRRVHRAEDQDSRQPAAGAETERDPRTDNRHPAPGTIRPGA